jgi:hypothetical protein
MKRNFNVKPSNSSIFGLVNSRPAPIENEGRMFLTPNISSFGVLSFEHCTNCLHWYLRECSNSYSI